MIGGLEVLFEDEDFFDVLCQIPGGGDVMRDLAAVVEAIRAADSLFEEGVTGSIGSGGGDLRVMATVVEASEDLLCEGDRVGLVPVHSCGGVDDLILEVEVFRSSCVRGTFEVPEEKGGGTGGVRTGGLIEEAMGLGEAEWGDSSRSEASWSVTVGVKVIGAITELRWERWWRLRRLLVGSDWDRKRRGLASKGSEEDLGALSRDETGEVGDLVGDALLDRKGGKFWYLYSLYTVNGLLDLDLDLEIPQTKTEITKPNEKR